MPTARFLIPGGEVNGKIYVFGGFTFSPAKSHLVTEIYDSASDTWLTGSDIPEKKVKYATCVVNDIIYVIGGFPDIGNTTGSTHVFIYNPGSATSVDESVPTDLTLSQNYPNPFNPITTITYNLDQSGMVNLVIYDILGRKVEDDCQRKSGARFVLSQMGRG